MTKIAVLGAGGFIGSNMVSHLKDQGHFVRAVSRSFRKERNPLFSKADQVVGLDLMDFRSTLLAVRDMDYVLMFASDMGGVQYFNTHDYMPFINNITLDTNVLQACQLAGVKRMFYASSACAYPTGLQMTEGKAPKLDEYLLNLGADADQMYGWEKLMTTKLCERAPFDARVGIQHTIFGPYQEIAGERMKFPPSIAVKAIKAKRNGKPIEIWGNGKQIRSYQYIDDAVAKIYEVLMAEEYFGPVNIGSEEAFTVTEIAEMCCTILGITPKFKYTDDMPSGVLARNCSNKKFNTYYKYRDKVTTYNGFSKLLSWIQNH